MKLSEDIDDKKAILTPENVGLIVKLCVERLNDKNYWEKSVELLTRCCSVVNPKQILASYIDFLLTKPLNPKMCVELEEFFGKMMLLLTVKYLPHSEMMSYAKNTLNSKEASSRKVGMTIITHFYSMMGDKIRESLEDVHPNVLKTLDGEFKKRSVNLKLEPTIEIVGNKKPIVPSVVKAPLAFEQEDVAQESGPKSDLKKVLTELIKCLKNPNWEVRKDGLQAAMKAFKESDYKFKTQGVDSLVYELSEKVDDTHKAVTTISLKFISEFARCLGSSFKAYSASYLPILFKYIPSKTSQVRAVALESIESIYDHVGSVVVLNAMLNATNEESPEGRMEIMKFILDRVEDLPGCDFKQAAKNLVTSLSHQKKEIRKDSTELISYIIPHSGDKIFRAACDQLKGNFRQEAHSILDELQGIEKDAEHTSGIGHNIMSTPSQTELKSSRAEAKSGPLVSNNRPNPRNERSKSRTQLRSRKNSI